MLGKFFAFGSLVGVVSYYRLTQKPPDTLSFRNYHDSCQRFFNETETQLSESCKGNLKIKKLVLHSSYDSSCEKQVTILIRYALALNVPELDLMFWDPYARDYELVLDESFFINTHFTHLKLSCNFAFPIYPISWQNLKSLSLSKMSLDENFIKNILSGCPLLETFKLKDCGGDDILELSIISKSLKNLVISGNTLFGTGDHAVLLDAPGISSLTIRGSLLLRQLLLVDVTTLLTASLDDADDDFGSFFGNEEDKILQRHMVALKHVEERNGLKLSERWLEASSRLKAQGKWLTGEYSYEDDSEDDYEYGLEVATWG